MNGINSVGVCAEERMTGQGSDRFRVAVTRARLCALAALCMAGSNCVESYGDGGGRPALSTIEQSLAVGEPYIMGGPEPFLAKEAVWSIAGGPDQSLIAWSTPSGTFARRIRHRDGSASDAAPIALGQYAPRLQVVFDPSVEQYWIVAMSVADVFAARVRASDGAVLEPLTTRVGTIDAQGGGINAVGAAASAGSLLVAIATQARYPDLGLSDLFALHRDAAGTTVQWTVSRDLGIYRSVSVAASSSGYLVTWTVATFCAGLSCPEYLLPDACAERNRRQALPLLASVESNSIYDKWYTILGRA